MAKTSKSKTPAQRSEVSIFGHLRLNNHHVNRPGSARDDALIKVTLHGKPRFKHDDTWVQGGRGAITFFRQEEHQHYYCRGLWEAYWFHLYPSQLILDILNRGGITHGISIPRAMSEPHMDELGEIFDYYRIPEPLMRYRLSLLVDRILIKSLGATPKPNTDPKSRRFDQLLEYIHLNCDKPHRIEDLAEIVGLSESRLAHRFKELYGQPIGQYLLRARMQYAGRLLHQTDLSIDELATHMGYKNPKSFYYAFRKIMGMTPNTYRNDPYAPMNALR